jgi:hypothetical protein
MNANKYTPTEGQDPSLSNITNVMQSKPNMGKNSDQKGQFGQHLSNNQTGNRNQKEGALYQKGFTPYKDAESDQYDDILEASPKDQFANTPNDKNYYQNKTYQNNAQLQSDNLASPAPDAHRFNNNFNQRRQFDSNMGQRSFADQTPQGQGPPMGHDQTEIQTEDENTLDAVFEAHNDLQDSGEKMRNMDSEGEEMGPQGVMEQNSQNEDENGNILPDQMEEIWKDLPLINPLLYKPASKPPIIREGDWLCPDSTCSSNFSKTKHE